MSKRMIPNIPKYRGDDPDLGAILDKLREAVERIIDTDFVTEKDIYCKDLITKESSIYIGSKNPKNKLENIKSDLYFNTVKITNSTPGGAFLADHANQHESGGSDEISHDNIAGIRGQAVYVQATEPTDPQINDIWIKI